MVLEFQPPPQGLIDAYLNKPSGIQMADQNIHDLMTAYIQNKEQESKDQTTAVGTLSKLADNVDFSDPNTIKAFGGLFKKAGISPAVFNPVTPPTTSTATVPSPVTAGTSDTQGNPVMAPAPSISPLIQASLAAGHPDLMGFNPNKLVMTGSGRKKLAAVESVAKYNEAVSAGQTRDAVNAPASFDEVNTTFNAAGKPDIAQQLIDNAKKQGQTTVQRKSVAGALAGLGVANTGIRGGALDVMAETRKWQAQANEWDKFEKRLNFVQSTGGALGMASKANLRGYRALDQLNDKEITPQQLTLVNDDLKGIMTGGVTPVSGIERSEFRTIQEKWANLQTWFGKPTPQNTPEIANKLRDIITGLRKIDNATVENNINIVGKGYKHLQKLDPERFQGQIDMVRQSLGKGGFQGETTQDHTGAEQWLKDNPNDPRAPAVRAKLSAVMGIQ